MGTKRLKRDEDIALRPTDFSGYIGQAAVKEVMEVSMEAAQDRGEPLEHILIWGPPGYGKTTLSMIIASEMGGELNLLLGGNLRTTKDVMPAFRQVEDGDLIFIDEIHRMWVPAQEVLYPAMEDGILNSKIANRMITTKLPPFTLIGATTMPEKLAPPFIDRFGIKLELVRYTIDEMKLIIQNTAARLGVEITDGAAGVVAVRSGGTPRVANSMMRRMRDFASYHGVEVMDVEFVEAIFEKEGLKWKI